MLGWVKGIVRPLTSSRKQERDFPGGAVVRNLPSNAGDMGLISGQ